MKNKIKKYLLKKINKVENKIFFITGGTGEIGSSLVEELLFLNAKIFLGVRDIQKAKEHFKNLNSFEYIYLDLEDMNSILCCATTLKQKNIDYVIINSGCSSNNFDVDIMVNFYAPYRLMEALGNTVEYVVMASISYKKKKYYQDYYAFAKRMLMQSCYLLKKEKEYKICLVHPGIVYTKLFCNRQSKKRILFPILKRVLPSKEQAAINILYCIDRNVPDRYWVEPEFFHTFGNPVIHKIRKNIFNKNEIEQVKKMIEGEKI